MKEHLGHTLLVYGYIDDVQIVASLDPHSQVDIGSDIFVAVNTASLHVFDPETEITLI